MNNQTKFEIVPYDKMSHLNTTLFLGSFVNINWNFSAINVLLESNSKEQIYSDLINVMLARAELFDAQMLFTFNCSIIAGRIGLFLKPLVCVDNTGKIESPDELEGIGDGILIASCVPGEEFQPEITGDNNYHSTYPQLLKDSNSILQVYKNALRSYQK